MIILYDKQLIEDNESIIPYFFHNYKDLCYTKIVSFLNLGNKNYAKQRQENPVIYLYLFCSHVGKLKFFLTPPYHVWLAV